MGLFPHTLIYSQLIRHGGFLNEVRYKSYNDNQIHFHQVTFLAVLPKIFFFKCDYFHKKTCIAKFHLDNVNMKKCRIIETICFYLTEHVYIAEVTSSHYRGLFGSFMSLCLAFGITYVIVVGAFVESWQLTTVACIVPVVIGKLKNVY